MVGPACDNGDMLMKQEIKRPRVAAIGLEESQLDSIAPLCGTLRAAGTLRGYLTAYSWSETDMTILGSDSRTMAQVPGHVLAIGPVNFEWAGGDPSPSEYPYLSWGSNTEREVAATTAATDLFGRLAAELAAQLQGSGHPPTVFHAAQFPQKSVEPLVVTTSGRPVALLCTSAYKPSSGQERHAVALALPQSAPLSAWLRAFLTIVHVADQHSVPQAPPKMSNPADWYTPTERTLAAQLTEIARQAERLEADRKRLEAELAAAGEQADAADRRCLWADGDELVAAVGRILEELGFVVRDMDAEKRIGEPKREDLRLTLPDHSRWEAIAEVKAYTNGSRTSDTRQIREQRDRYIKEQGRPPELTLWIANPYRSITDPSDRPAPDNNVAESAAIIEAVHVTTADLYRLWALVQAGSMGREEAVQHLINSSPGLWSLPAQNPQGTA